MSAKEVKKYATFFPIQRVCYR